MPKQKRHSTPYPGVYFINGTSPATGKKEKVFYIRYRRDGKVIEEKAGWARINDMTAARANRIRAKRIEGKPSNKERRAAARWTIDRLWETYSETHILKGSKSDQSRYRVHIRPAFGHKTPEEIDPLSIDRLRMTTVKAGYEPQTVKHVLALLRRIVLFGVKRNLCQGIGAIEMPEVFNILDDTLTEAERAAVLQAVDKDPNQDDARVIKVCAFSGLRLSSVLGLKWEHAHLEDTYFRFGHLWIREAKAEQCFHFPLNPNLRSTLLEQPRGDSDYLFPGRKGQRRCLSPGFVRRLRASCPFMATKRPTYCWRHTFMTAGLKAGFDRDTMNALLGHSQSDRIWDRYGHLDNERLLKASIAASTVGGYSYPSIEKAANADAT